MDKKIYQIQIALKGSKPKIWRRILVPSDMSLSKFHTIIQITMGWTNSHLHQFIKDRVYYSTRLEDDIFWDDSINVDYKKMKIADLVKREKEKITYEYDFGDSWEHDVILEKISPMVETFKHPICLTGKMNCPPEDCGGVWGYADMLEILKDPKHEEYETYMDWLDEDFDPKTFNIEEVNQLLSKILIK